MAYQRCDKCGMRGLTVDRYDPRGLDLKCIHCGHAVVGLTAQEARQRMERVIRGLPPVEWLRETAHGYQGGINEG